MLPAQNAILVPIHAYLAPNLLPLARGPQAGRMPLERDGPCPSGQFLHGHSEFPLGQSREQLASPPSFPS